ncbi:MAG TPA: lysylphosphatidylglycerol synthase transmembrane domain-containing protein, partial [Ignavibacteriaceae bacterium]|nr:lysylphosphatidylglycerol synthase transmembrane domain-containing protein [Ignavibacteriaceae bacterium]
LIYWILKGTNFKEIFLSISSANFILVILSFSLHFIGFYVSAVRWKLLLQAQGVEAKISYLIKSYIVSTFFNNLLPSIVGGDTIRAYDSYKAGKSKSGAVAVIFVDRFLGLFALMIFALGAVFFSTKITSQIPYLFLWVAAGFLLMALVVWIIFFPSKKLSALISKIKIPFSSKLQRILEKIIEAFWIFKGQKKVLVKALGLSFILHANVVTYYFLIASAFNFPVPYYYFYLIVPLAVFVMMLPVSINGIGLRENTFFFFLSAFAITKPDAIAFAWVEYGMIILLGVIGGIVYAIRK